MDDELEQRIDDAIMAFANQAVARGSLVATFLAAAGATALVGMYIATQSPMWLPPLFATCLGGPLAAAGWWFASHRQVDRAIAQSTTLAVAAIPGLAIAGGSWLPSGFATYIHGSFGWVWLFLVCVSGLYLDRRLPVITGAFCAVQYGMLFTLAQPQLAVLEGPQSLIDNLSSPFIALVKASVLVLSGVVVGGIGEVARAMVRRLVEEERAKEEVRRVFGQYVSQEVSDHLLSGPSALSKRVEVVVLFADLRGFTRFSEGRDPSEVVERLNAYLQCMVDAVHAEGGVVDKFMGDAIMAVFGGVAVMEHPADRALSAALGMRRALDTLNDTWAVEGIAAFEHGIGIHTGGVFQGPIGSRERKEFTVIGDAVNLASRLEGLTKPLGHGILVTGELADALSDPARAQLTDLGDHAIRGREEPIRVYGMDATSRQR